VGCGFSKQRELDRTPQAQSQQILLFLFRDSHANAGSIRHDVMSMYPKPRPRKHKFTVTALTVAAFPADAITTRSSATACRSWK
jgi:hypothetical protein